jgi:hypothetical protein
MDTAKMAELYSVCKFCLFDGFYLIYGLFILAVSILASKADQPIADRGRLPPIPGRELQYQIAEHKPDISIVTKNFKIALSIASFSSFVYITQSATRFIRTIFLMADNPTLLRSFWRYFNIYYLLVFMPAAFMPPVSHPQRPPDFQLLAAVMLLICANALGDLISVRVILRIFKKFDPLTRAHLNNSSQLEVIKYEITYYFAIIRGGLYSLFVLIAVLVISSICYGVQIGQMDFAFSEEFFRNAWDRIARFPEIAFTLYWFRDQPGPFGFAGIPGLLIYGLTTFLPIIILFFLAIIWLLLIPFRIAVNLPATTSPTVRVISAEAAVFAMCLTISLLIGRILIS